MSRDDGVYILESPISARQAEFRVANVAAIEGEDPDSWGDEFLLERFGDSKVYATRLLAWQKASQINAEDRTEYGINTILLSRRFPMKENKPVKYDIHEVPELNTLICLESVNESLAKEALKEGRWATALALRGELNIPDFESVG